jgi:signal transduction histidine kinase
VLWWQLTALANAIILVAYLAISFAIGRGLWRSRQWRNNPLGLATAAIFFSCAIHHGSHTVHLLLPYVGLDVHTGLVMRHAFGMGFQMVAWDIVTAGVAVWYWTLRGRFPALVRGAAVFEDLKLRQAAEATLRASEERYRGIVETTSEGVLLLDADGRITYANGRFAAMLGRPLDDLAGTALIDLVTVADRAATGRELAAAAGGTRRLPTGPEPTQTQTPAPTPTPTNSGTWRLTTGPEPTPTDSSTRRLAAGLGPASADGGTRRLDVGLHRAGGQVMRAQVALTARVDDGGVLAMIADVTEQKNIEAQLRQAQKLDAVGQLAGGVAHDFNNLLTVIDGYAALLIAGADETSAGDLRMIRDAAARAGALTRQLLTFSRTQTAEAGVVDVVGLVAGVEGMLRRLIREDVQLVVSASTAPLPVWADPGQLEQVLINLAVNARDAMPDGGVLTIATRRVDGGGSALVTVSDTGSGMSAEVAARVFEPFFTTKEPGKGTGLGLSTVYGIVTQAGGQIRVDTGPGMGTTFEVRLPVTTRPAAAPPPDPVAKRLATGTETILLVEDDPAVRRLTERILRSAGYHVLTAADGREGLEIVRADPAIRLLITDVVMPGMNGRQLADQVAAVRPGLPVIFTSAHTRGVVTHSAFLEKPYTATEITQKVRTVLDARIAA